MTGGLVQIYIGHARTGRTMLANRRLRCRSSCAKMVWGCSSAGEHFVDIEGVTGSIPVTPTIFSFYINCLTDRELCVFTARTLNVGPIEPKRSVKWLQLLKEAHVIVFKFVGTA